jgi:hypothetical protein
MKFRIPNIGFVATQEDGSEKLESGGSVVIETATLQDATMVVFNLWESLPDGIVENDELWFEMPTGYHHQFHFYEPDWSCVTERIGLDRYWRGQGPKPEVIRLISDWLEMTKRHQELLAAIKSELEAWEAKLAAKAD